MVANGRAKGGGSMSRNSIFVHEGRVRNLECHTVLMFSCFTLLPLSSFGEWRRVLRKREKVCVHVWMYMLMWRSQSPSPSLHDGRDLPPPPNRTRYHVRDHPLHPNPSCRIYVCVARRPPASPCLNERLHLHFHVRGDAWMGSRNDRPRRASSAHHLPPCTLTILRTIQYFY